MMHFALALHATREELIELAGELGRRPRAARLDRALLPGLPRRRRRARRRPGGGDRRVRAGAAHRPAPAAVRDRRGQPRPAPGDEPRELHDRARAAVGRRAARDRAGLEDGRRGDAALVGRAGPRVRGGLVSRRLGGRPRRAAQVRLRPLVHARRLRARAAPACRCSPRTAARRSRSTRRTPNPRRAEPRAGAPTMGAWISSGCSARWTTPASPRSAPARCGRGPRAARAATRR